MESWPPPATPGINPLAASHLQAPPGPFGVFTAPMCRQVLLPLGRSERSIVGQWRTQIQNKQDIDRQRKSVRELIREGGRQKEGKQGREKKQIERGKKDFFILFLLFFVNLCNNLSCNYHGCCGSGSLLGWVILKYREYLRDIQKNILNEGNSCYFATAMTQQQPTEATASSSNFL